MYIEFLMDGFRIGFQVLAQRRGVYLSSIPTYINVYHIYIYRASGAEQCSLFIHPKSSSVKVQKQVVVAYRVVLLLLLLLIYLP